MELQIPPELEAKLSRLAQHNGRSVSDFAIDLLTNSLEYDEWFRAEVEKGRRSAREEPLSTHEEVASRIRSRYSE